MLNLFKRKRKLDQSSTSQPAPKPIQEAEASVRLRANIGYQQLEQRKVLSASFIGSAGGLIVDSFAPGQDLVFSQTTSVINGTAQDSFALEVSSGSFLGSTINPLIELESVNGGTNNRLEVATNLFGGAANAQISLDGATSVGSEVEFDQAGGPINFASLDISNFTNQDRGFSLNTIGDVTASNISVVDSNPLDSLDPAANLSINTQGSITTTGSIENSIDNPLDGVSLIASGQNNDITVVDRIETLSGSIVLSAGDSVQLASTGQILSGGAGDTTITSGTSPATGNSGDQISMTDGSRIDVGFGQANLTAQGDVLISEITSLASGDAITITTSQQIIDNTAAESDNVISNNGRSRFLSTGDIGGSGAANINIQADSLEFDTDGSATISDSNAGLTIDRASRADGGAAIDSSGPLTISQNIDVGASSSFATNNSTSIDDDLTINNNAIVSLSTTLGAQLEFTAGDDIVFDGGSFATTGGNSIVLIADNALRAASRIFSQPNLLRSRLMELEILALRLEPMSIV